MKRRFLTLILAAALLALCAACTPSGEAPEETGPAETGPVQTEEPEQSAPPAEYDFTDVTLDEYTETLTGFEGLPWGYVLPRELADDLGGRSTVTLMDQTASFAGLSVIACHLFQEEEGGMTLLSGQFSRLGYRSAAEWTPQREEAEDWPVRAAADFNQMLAYLTRLYGEPTSCALSPGGSGDAALTGPVTAQQLTAEGVTGCSAFWKELDGGTVSLVLGSGYGGMITVSFMAKPADTQTVTLTSGACTGFGGLAWGDSYEDLFPGDEVPEDARRDCQLDGWPCAAVYSFDESGLLWWGQYEFRPSQADVPAVLRAALAAMTEAYGEPLAMYTPVDGQQVPAPTVDDVEAGAADFCIYTWGGLDNGQGGRANTVLQLQDGVVYLALYCPPGQ